jgi:hypothetical protein
MTDRALSNYLVPHEQGDLINGRVLRRIVDIDVVVYTHPPERRLTLNCGHTVNVPRGLRPTVGKLTPCPWCE